MELRQTSLFKRNYKKLHPKQQTAVKSEIKKLLADPSLGTEKKQDLRGIYVHKFLIGRQLFLLAYSFDPQTMTLVMLGVHENFYRDLKNHLSD